MQILTRLPLVGTYNNRGNFAYFYSRKRRKYFLINFRNANSQATAYYYKMNIYHFLKHFTYSTTCYVKD